MGQSSPSFHPLPDLLPLRAASDRHPPQGPQTGPESAARSSHGRPRNGGPSAHTGCDNPPWDWTGLPTWRGACLPHHPSASAHTDRLSHAGTQDGERCAHSRGQFGSSDRSVQLVRPQYILYELLWANLVLYDCVGAVLPVGGVLLAESFIEPLSGRMVRVRGANMRAGHLVPNSGGYQRLLDCKVLDYTPLDVVYSLL